MEQAHFQAQMNRLAAAYRVNIPAETRAAYWLAFGSGDDARFAAACERAIEHERAFPPIAALKELIRQHHDAAHRAPGPTDASLLSTGTVGCLTCMDAGFISRDLPVQHPDFGKRVPCPHCDGAKKPRDYQAEALAFVKRDRAGRAPLPPREDGPLRDAAEKIARQLRPDEQGAHSRWTAPMPVTGERTDTP